MNISQWSIGDRTFFSLEVDDRLLLIETLLLLHYYLQQVVEARLIIEKDSRIVGTRGPQ